MVHARGEDVRTAASWKMRPFSWQAAEQISHELGLPLLTGVVMARRGLTDPQQARAFLEPDGLVPNPFLLHGVEEAVERIAACLESGRRIVVHGDYDVDGISATALMVLGLRPFGVDPEWFLPSRFGHGYGLSRGAVEELAAGGPGLLITVDCGVNYPDEVQLAMSLGMDVVVTDHHTPGEVIPRTTIVHPRLSVYPGSDLCGVGVALKLLHGLHVRLADADEDRLPAGLLELLDLVALGTVADIVPLVGENRYYVKEGLKRIGWKPRPGIRALLDVANCTPETVDTSTVAYRLAPRLNAPGRLKSPDLPLQLLLTEDPATARSIAQRLDEINRDRQEVEAAILRDALSQAEALDPMPPALVLGAQGWHEGVVGIVASRLVERFHRPVILLAVKGERAKGSGRSIPSYDLIRGLTASAELLEVFGGHKQAAGLTLARTNVERFRESFLAHAASVLTDNDLTPTFSPDAVVSGSDLTIECAEALALLAPFGAGNPAVRLLALGAGLENVAPTRNGDHLRCNLVLDGVRARGIGFGLAKDPEVLALLGERLHAGVRLEVNRWNGTVRSEVVLNSLFAVDSAGEEALGCSPKCPYLDDLDAPPACPHCADPFGDTCIDADARVPGRDLRGQGRQFATIAQVVSSGEPVAVVACSVAHRLGQVAAMVPLRDVGATGVDCVSRLCWRTRLAGLREDTLLFMDWTAAVRRHELLGCRHHLIALDPPHRRSHLALLKSYVDTGGAVHLCYGGPEREFTERFLKASAHPRVWMVPLYRALRSGMTRGQAMDHVARRAWEEGTIPPTGEDLQRAWRILEAMDLVAVQPEGPDRDPSTVEEYVAAAADYEEAVRLCRML